MGQITRQLLLSVFMTVGLAGCLKNPSRHPSVLILAVEKLGSLDLTCAEDLKPGVQSGLDLLCQESPSLVTLRTTSSEALPSLGSFLFGVPLDQLRLQTPSSFIRSDLESFAETAHARGWTTGFFGSSPLFMRRSGLGQGFEVFEESLQIENLRWGRRSEAVVSSFLRWFSEMSDQGPFYSVLTFSDLNFPWMKTVNLSGQERVRSIESQMEAVSDSWLPLFRRLKENKTWDKTWVIVIGLQARMDTAGPLSIALVKPPHTHAALTKQEQPLTLSEMSQLLHQDIFGLPSSQPVNAEASPPPAKNPWPAGEFWLQPPKSPERAQILREKLRSDPTLRPWFLYELMEQGKAQEFIRVAMNGGPMDATAFWERVLLKNRTQILQDPCLRMIDLKIFEGGGSKTCESPTLLALQDWLRHSEPGSEEAHQREARTRTLRSLHELRSISRIHNVNHALGNPLSLPHDIGDEILRTEMALRFPDLESNRAWLDQAEATLSEKAE